jgi:hypothetical protein
MEAAERGGRRLVDSMGGGRMIPSRMTLGDLIQIAALLLAGTMAYGDLKGDVRAMRASSDARFDNITAQIELRAGETNRRLDRLERSEPSTRSSFRRQ